MTNKRLEWPPESARAIEQISRIGEKWLADNSSPKISDRPLYDIDGQTWSFSESHWACLLDLFIRYMPAMEEPSAIQRLATIAHYSDWNKDQIYSLCRRAVSCVEIETAAEFVDLMLIRMATDGFGLDERRQFVSSILREHRFRSTHDKNVFMNLMNARLRN